MNTADVKDSRAVKSGPLACILFCIVAFLLAGCGTVAKVKKTANRVVREFRIEDDGLSKRAVLLPFTNHSALPMENFSLQYPSRIAETLGAECPKLRLTLPSDPDFPAEFSPLPRLEAGWVDSLKLAEEARGKDFNIIVAGDLTTAGMYQDARGILWFRKDLVFFQLQILISAYDALTGAKILDDTFRRDVEIEPVDSGFTPDAAEIRRIADETLAELGMEIGEAICMAAMEVPWTGIVSSVAEGQALIPGSSAIGLSEGDVLNVFNSTEIVEGAMGQRFYAPGRKVGQLRVSGFTEAGILALPLGSFMPAAGQSVRLEN